MVPVLIPPPLQQFINLISPEVTEEYYCEARTSRIKIIEAKAYGKSFVIMDCPGIDDTRGMRESDILADITERLAIV